MIKYRPFRTAAAQKANARPALTAGGTDAGSVGCSKVGPWLDRT
jgi:hypothetical protein